MYLILVFGSNEVKIIFILLVTPQIVNSLYFYTQLVAKQSEMAKGAAFVKRSYLLFMITLGLIIDDYHK